MMWAVASKRVHATTILACKRGLTSQQSHISGFRATTSTVIGVQAPEVVPFRTMSTAGKKKKKPKQQDPINSNDTKKVPSRRRRGPRLVTGYHYLIDRDFEWVGKDPDTGEPMFIDWKRKVG